MASLARGTRFRWALARALACLGALLATVAVQMPWVILMVKPPGWFGDAFPTLSDPLAGRAFPFLLYLRIISNRRIDTPFLEWSLELLWTGIFLGGILLALALWQRSSVRLQRLTKAIFRGWLVAATALVGLAAWVILPDDPLAGSGSNAVILSRSLGPGLWLALAALALLWAGVYLMLGEPRIQESAAPHTWRRTRAQALALGTLLVGMVLWGVGYLALPWASGNCATIHLSLTHYVDSTCAALDSGDTLMAYVSPHLSASTSIGWFAQNILVLGFVLLYGAAPLLLLGAGRSVYTRGFCGWVLVWLLAATGMALLSYRGVSAAIANPPYFAGGAWHGDLGIAVTLAGLVCTWASLIPLEAAALAAPPTRQASGDVGALAVDAAQSGTLMR